MPNGKGRQESQQKAGTGINTRLYHGDGPQAKSHRWPEGEGRKRGRKHQHRLLPVQPLRQLPADPVARDADSKHGGEENTERRRPPLLIHQADDERREDHGPHGENAAARESQYRGWRARRKECAQ